MDEPISISKTAFWDSKAYACRTRTRHRRIKKTLCRLLIGRLSCAVRGVNTRMGAGLRITNSSTVLTAGWMRQSGDVMNRLFQVFLSHLPFFPSVDKGPVIISRIRSSPPGPPSSRYDALQSRAMNNARHFILCAP